MFQLQFIKIIKVAIATRLCHRKLIYQSFFPRIYKQYDFSSYVVLESLQNTAKKYTVICLSKCKNSYDKIMLIFLNFLLILEMFPKFSN